MQTLGILGWMQGWEWIVLVVLALLLFGRRLPSIARSLGQSIVEFKKGIKGVQDQIETEASKPETTSTPKKEDVIDVAASSKSGES